MPLNLDNVVVFHLFADTAPSNLEYWFSVNTGNDQSAVKIEATHNSRRADYSTKDNAPNGLALHIIGLKGILVLDFFTPPSAGAKAVDCEIGGNKSTPFVGKQAAVAISDGIAIAELSKVLCWTLSGAQSCMYAQNSELDGRRAKVALAAGFAPCVGLSLGHILCLDYIELGLMTVATMNSKPRMVLLFMDSNLLFAWLVHLSVDRSHWSSFENTTHSERQVAATKPFSTRAPTSSTIECIWPDVMWIFRACPDGIVIFESSSLVFQAQKHALTDHFDSPTFLAAERIDSSTPT
ncbi:hypothetical protein E2P81_ATG03523 [Venturia nashicola]|uniref:Uncharacterized protein n=1 Tax=Venturia nashicola TaxID=86259 RepID=A0A4Z1PRP5_9PEZI|nr:hypothetical protein E6O75_ATG03595 [Venturia nashicola]TLD37848.1 hypothetical protein E2P81_ATG03523 [Venturia nashicola]